MKTLKRPGSVSDPTGNVALLVVGSIGLVIFTPILLAWGAARLTHATNDGATIWFIKLLVHGTGWSTAATVAILLLLLCATAGFLGLALTVKRLRRVEKPIDASAKFLCTTKDVEVVSTKAAGLWAAQAGVDSTCGPGVPIGRSVLGNVSISGTWESTQLWIMGTRAGKSSMLAIPQILATEGPVISTSNKPDVFQATSLTRSAVGKVWLHDPQQLSGKAEPFRWCPLSHIHDPASAMEIARALHTSAHDGEIKADYWTSAGEEYLSNLLLAAACEDKTLFDVFEWSRDPEDKQPEEILSDHGHALSSQALRSTRLLTPKQRDGVVSTAHISLAFITSPSIRPWLESANETFDVEQFVRSRDTLYLMSAAGPGSVRALTATLTIAVTKAAERLGVAQGGRLKRPLLVSLDEAANICRWLELPQVASHYGSRGIILVIFLQSMAQGQKLWGQGMEALWSTANVRGVGKGMADPAFADKISQICGDREVHVRSVSSGKGGASTSLSTRPERVLQASDIVSIPDQRALILVSGHRPVLVKLSHWSDSHFADEIVESNRLGGVLG